MHVISSGGIPLALFLLLRGYRRGSAATILAGWLVADLAVLARLHARPHARLPARRRHGRGGGRLVAARAPAPAAPRARRDRRRDALPRGRRRPARAPLPARARPTTPRRSARSRTSPTSPGRRTSSSPRRARAASGATPPRRCATDLGAIAEMTLFPGLAILALALAGWRAGPAAAPPAPLAWPSACSPSRSSRSASSSTASRGCIPTAGSTSCCPAGRASACPGA